MENGTDFFEKKSSYRKSGLIMLLAAGSEAAAFFLNQWNIYVKIGNKSYGGFGFFDILKKAVGEILPHNAGFEKIGFTLTFSNLFLLLLTIFYIMVIVFTLLFAINDSLTTKNVNEKKFLRKNYLLWRILPAIIWIVVFIFMTHTKLYKAEFNNLSDLKAGWLSQIKYLKGIYAVGCRSMKCVIFRGAGFYFGLLSVLLYLISTGYTFICDTLNEDKSS